MSTVKLSIIAVILLSIVAITTQFFVVPLDSKVMSIVRENSIMRTELMDMASYKFKVKQQLKDERIIRDYLYVEDYIRDVLGPTITKFNVGEVAKAIVDGANIKGYPVSIVVGMVENESMFDPKAISSEGAMGLLQVIHRLWGGVLEIEDKTVLLKPYEGVVYGLETLDVFMARHDGDIGEALWNYNGKAPKDSKMFVNKVFASTCKFLTFRNNLISQREKLAEEAAKKAEESKKVETPPSTETK